MITSKQTEGAEGQRTTMPTDPDVPNDVANTDGSRDAKDANASISERTAVATAAAKVTEATEQHQRQANRDKNSK